MAGARIKPEDLSKTIKKTLDTYEESVTEKVKRSVKQAADLAVKELKASSPKKTGRYGKSWKQKKTHEDSKELEVTVYAGVYQLTHLLENGHAKRGGGRVEGIPHIEPAREHVAKMLEEEIKKEIRHG